MNAAEIRQHKGRIGGLVVTAFPKDFAGSLIESNETGAGGAADGNEDTVAIDNSAAIIAAAAGRPFPCLAPEEFDAEIFFETYAPNDFA